jgi:hypothetical protein
MQTREICSFPRVIFEAIAVLIATPERAMHCVRGCYNHLQFGHQVRLARPVAMR